MRSTKVTKNETPKTEPQKTRVKKSDRFTTPFLTGNIGGKKRSHLHAVAVTGDSAFRIGQVLLHTVVTRVATILCSLPHRKWSQDQANKNDGRQLKQKYSHNLNT